MLILKRTALSGEVEKKILSRYMQQKFIYMDEHVLIVYQMNSGESLDPRVVEATLNQCPAIARSCIFGNNFLKAPSQVVCAIIEPVRDNPETSALPEARLREITRAIASANRGLAPPLRISWSRVLVLNGNQQIPLTKKGTIFRKKLEELFGEQMGSMLLNCSEKVPLVQAEMEPIANGGSKDVQTKTRDQISNIITEVVVEALHISFETLENNPSATFAEVCESLKYNVYSTEILC